VLFQVFRCTIRKWKQLKYLTARVEHMTLTTMIAEIYTNIYSYRNLNGVIDCIIA
jgi:hypothetical protein